MGRNSAAWLRLEVEVSSIEEEFGGSPAVPIIIDSMSIYQGRTKEHSKVSTPRVSNEIIVMSLGFIRTDLGNDSLIIVLQSGLIQLELMIEKAILRWYTKPNVSVAILSVQD